MYQYVVPAQFYAPYVEGLNGVSHPVKMLGRHSTEAILHIYPGFRDYGMK